MSKISSQASHLKPFCGFLLHARVSGDTVETVPFPRSYRKPLESRQKTVTIRTGAEYRRRYKLGQPYRAVTYDGQPIDAVIAFHRQYNVFPRMSLSQEAMAECGLADEDLEGIEPPFSVFLFDYIE